MALAEVLGLRNFAWVQEDYRRREWGGLNCETAPPGAWDNLAQALQAQEHRRRGPVLNLLSRLSTRTLSIADRITNVAAWTIGGTGGVNGLWGISYLFPERFNPLFGGLHAAAGVALILAAEPIMAANRVIRQELSHRLHRQ